VDLATAGAAEVVVGGADLVTVAAEVVVVAVRLVVEEVLALEVSPALRVRKLRSRRLKSVYRLLRYVKSLDYIYFLHWSSLDVCHFLG
jgi:hypothetical protein